MKYLIIGLGGFLGTVARYWLSNWVGERVGETFPWGTLVVNVSGCFVMGFIFSITPPEGKFPISNEWRPFVMVGVLGGFTTFSAFSLQTLNLIQERQWLYAGGNVMGSVVLCMLGVWLGHVLAKAC